ncbi:DEKNAAC104360 [Brettanomyces naardenensis]|uniref:DEKNAAC104360 n=1 Tax=Brettanomyces naardenensis TaxID=13370 RepID=A0A448YQL6_BRENA|nr:DEKNAAC104360 [Brettanomyces naardenensis]
MFPHPIFSKLSTFTFYLCTTSPRRQQIIQQLGFKPIVIAPTFEENLDKTIYTVKQYVTETATGKILSVWNSLDESERHGDILLLSADTVVENDGRIYEKPKTYEENCRMLKELRDSPTPTYIHSGVVLLLGDETRPDGYRMERFVETTGVVMKKEVSDEFIEQYCKSGEGLTVAGGFRIQGYGSTFITGIRGDFFNGVGLPAGRTFDKICEILQCEI